MLTWDKWLTWGEGRTRAKCDTNPVPEMREKCKSPAQRAAGTSQEASPGTQTLLCPPESLALHSIPGTAFPVSLWGCWEPVPMDQLLLAVCRCGTPIPGLFLQSLPLDLPLPNPGVEPPFQGLFLPFSLLDYPLPNPGEFPSPGLVLSPPSPPLPAPTPRSVPALVPPVPHKAGELSLAGQSWRPP